jgi:HSP20 family molecular chaperone IbpA
MMNPTIEETIERVEQLYATITGHLPPHVNGNRTRMPPEIDPVRYVEDQLAKLVAAIEQRFTPGGAPATPAWTPRAFAWQDDTGIELALDVPGVAREQLEVRLDGPMLVVRGHRPPPWGERDLQRAPDAHEAPVGTFARAFPLPERVEPGQISARLDDGVLYVRVARVPRSEPSPIAIQG